MSKTPLATFRHKDVYVKSGQGRICTVFTYLSNEVINYYEIKCNFDGELIGLTHTIIIFEKKWWDIFSIYFYFMGHFFGDALYLRCTNIRIHTMEDDFLACACKCFFVQYNGTLGHCTGGVILNRIHAQSMSGLVKCSLSVLFVRSLMNNILPQHNTRTRNTFLFKASSLHTCQN